MLAPSADAASRASRTGAFAGWPVPVPPTGTECARASWGLVTTGGVITAAGVVLAATFAALGVIRLAFLVQTAFIAAFGVLLDTLLVRSLTVPALVRDVGALSWC